MLAGTRPGTAPSEKPTTIGSRVVVGHLAHLEGCTIEDDALVGSGSIVLHDAVVRSGGLVGAGAVVSNGVEVPAKAMALRIPAKMRLDAVPDGTFTQAVELYAWNGGRYKEESAGCADRPTLPGCRRPPGA